MKMTLTQATALIERADSLFNRATRAWERGNNSGNSEGLAKGERQCNQMRSQAEELLKPLGIEVDYPGLFPSFKGPDGRAYHTTESAVSAALEFGLPEAEESRRGALLAEGLMLKRDREHKDRWQTTWGTKTDMGLFRIIKRMVEDGE